MELVDHAIDTSQGPTRRCPPPTDQNAGGRSVVASPSSATHRAHWVGWLDEYDGPGYYNRRVPKTPRSMAYIYGHIHCAPMLLWLAEAAGVPRRSIATANAAMTRLTTSGLSDSHPRTSTAVRKIIPWSSVHLALVERGLLTP